MRSDPLDFPVALRIGKETVRKMRQNLGWAVGYNVIVAVNALLLKRLRLPVLAGSAAIGPGPDVTASPIGTR